MNITSKQFQRQRLDKVVKLAGPRYEKGVNIELPIRSVFHALIKSQKFIDKVNDTAYRLLEASQYTGIEPFYSISKSHYDTIKNQKKHVINRLRAIATDSPNKSIRIKPIVNRIRNLLNVTDELIELLEAADEAKQVSLPKDSHQSFREEINGLYELTREANSTKAFIEGDDFSTFLYKAFLLKGEAGIGKTHLFCDFANEAYTLGHQVYIFLGEEFTTNTNPTKRMGLLLENANYLHKINDEAKKFGKRAVILIDAVNEAQVKVDWDLLTEISQYKYISFAISIRTGYEDAILSSRMQRNIRTIEHLGLNANNLSNIEAFFSYFKVPMPDVPLISHEFNNPLFVKIFCRTYAKKRTVRGDIGSTTLFEDYVRYQTKQVKRSAGLPSNTHIWNTFIKPLAEWMGQNATNRVLDNKAHNLIEKMAPGKSSIILQEMERHWLLTKVPHYTGGGKVHGYEYRFPYQRFSDHLIVRYLLNHHLKSTKNPKQYFEKNTPLGKIISPNYPDYYLRRGLVEAMAIQIPERLKGIELVDIAPDKFKDTMIAEETFLNSLLWRDLETKDGTWKYFNKDTVRKYINYYSRGNATSNGFDSVLVTILSTSCIENHPLEASVLHDFLKKRKMPERDSFWLPFLYYQYGEEGSIIDRYISWTSSSLARKMKSKAVIRQTSIVMSWFLASSDRRLRDKTTKALVNLLDGRYLIIKELLELFSDVDDNYIIERLYAVAYGCTLRESQPSKLKTLAQYVYDHEFLDNKPNVHILIRDYARGIVETYHHAYPSILFDERLYKPPYTSTFPVRIISDKALERKYPHSENENESYGSISFSVRANVGDFGRYVIESNLHNFSNVRLDGTATPSESDRCEQILKSLSPTQKKLVQIIRGDPLTRILSVSFFSSPTKKYRWPNKKVDGKDVCDSWFKLKGLLKLSVPDNKTLKKYLRGDRLQDNSSFDALRGSRWIFQRTIQLGWNPVIHGGFDRNIQRNSYDRHTHKIERIGKKYQWQALYEFMARVADNYQMIEREGGTYNGPWQLHLRNIDPSHTIEEPGQKSPQQTWWQKVSYNSWHLDLSEQDWLQLDDIPDMKNLILTKDTNGKSWLNLSIYFDNRQRLDHIPKDKQYNHRRREFWVILKSYVIKKRDLNNFIKWASSQNYEGRWMPESHEFYTAFYREYPYYPAFTDQYSEYYGRVDWHNKTKQIPFDLMVTDDEYREEGSGYDQSLNEGFSIKLPTKQIYVDMDTRSSSTDGQYKNNSNEIIFQDPHIKNGGTEALLTSTTHFTDYLKSKGYAVVWTILGEKQVIGGDLGRDNDWPGRYEFSGTYYLDNTTMEVCGDMHTKKFRVRDDQS